MPAELAEYSRSRRHEPVHDARLPRRHQRRPVRRLQRSRSTRARSCSTSSTRIQATQANDLAVRWNCKAGKCGSCSAEVNGKPRLMCMTRMNLFDEAEPITVAPMKTFPIIKDLVTDVSFNYEVAKRHPGLQAARAEAGRTLPDAAGGRRARAGVPQVHRVLPLPERLPRDPRPPREQAEVLRPALLRPPGGAGDAPAGHGRPHGAHPRSRGHRLCNITKCCTEVCPEDIHITDNAIIPLKERVADQYYDPFRWIFDRIRGK